MGRVDHREPGPAVAEEVLVQRLLDRQLVGDRHRFAVHDVGDLQLADPAGDRRLGGRRPGGAVDDEADQGEPDAAEDVAIEGEQEAGADEEVAEDAAEVGGEAGGGGAVAGAPPGDRPGDPAAVHREGRQQVEDEDEEVDHRQPGDHRQHARGRGAALDQRGLAEVVPAGGGDPDRSQRGDDGEGDRRAGDRDLEFGPRRFRFAVIRAIPPKIQSWMLEMPIPLRRATKACPSSCRTIEPKNPTGSPAPAGRARRGALSPSSSP